MLHYSCDRCNRMLDPEEDLRYVVKLEAYAAFEPADAEDHDCDRDHLQEVHEILENLEDFESDEVSEDVYRKSRYDLCCECFKQFMENPVGRETPARIGFSQN